MSIYVHIHWIITIVRYSNIYMHIDVCIYIYNVYSIYNYSIYNVYSIHVMYI